MTRIPSLCCHGPVRRGDFLPIPAHVELEQVLALKYRREKWRQFWAP